MVKITNNIDTFNVSNGAFESIFKGMGFVKVHDDSNEVEGQLNVNDVELGMSEDDKFLVEIVEKPISQWSKAEVKKYVELKGIDTSGASTLTEVKELIKLTVI